MAEQEQQQQNDASSAANVESGENDVVNGENSSAEDKPAEPEYQKSGWLMKRTKLTHKWERQWFCLKKTQLHYGCTENNATKCITLDGTEISEAHIDKKPYVFRLKPKDTSRVYYIHAENENDQQEWMQAICFAKATGNHGDQSQACIIQ
ncbi:PH domain-containing protein DDB_G0274775-like [Glandiceps talaboti]